MIFLLLQQIDLFYIIYYIIMYISIYEKLISNEYYLQFITLSI
jgi:hypothetical protein